jgi:hypothetical protein
LVIVAKAEGIDSRGQVRHQGTSLKLLLEIFFQQTALSFIMLFLVIGTLHVSVA